VDDERRTQREGREGREGKAKEGKNMPVIRGFFKR